MVSILRVLVSIVFLIIHGAIGIVHLFTLRDLVMMYAQQHSDVFSWRFIELIAAIILSIVWLVLISVLQHFYEKDLKISWFPKRFLIVLAIQLVLYGGTVLLLNLG